MRRDEEKTFSFQTTEICFGSTKMGIFYREKAFHAGKKIRKNDFAPSEKYSSYAPDCFDVFLEFQTILHDISGIPKTNREIGHRGTIISG